MSPQMKNIPLCLQPDQFSHFSACATFSFTPRPAGGFCPSFSSSLRCPSIPSSLSSQEGLRSMMAPQSPWKGSRWALFPAVRAAHHGLLQARHTQSCHLPRETPMGTYAESRAGGSARWCSAAMVPGAWAQSCPCHPREGGRTGPSP